MFWARRGKCSHYEKYTQSVLYPRQSSAIQGNFRALGDVRKKQILNSTPLGLPVSQKRRAGGGGEAKKCF